MTIQRFSPVARAAISQSDAGEYVKYSDIADLLDEIKTMREAIELAIAPGLWIQREEDIFQYTGKVWYGDLLKQAICRENTDEQ